MPPATGKIVRQDWTSGTGTDATILPKPMPKVDLTRTVSFTAPGNYVIRVPANGQRNGLVDSGNQTLAQNFNEVRVIVNAPPSCRGPDGMPRGEGWEGISGGAAPGNQCVGLQTRDSGGSVGS